MLIEHFLKLPLGLPFESDEFHPVSIVFLPPDDGQRDDDWDTGPGKLDMQAKMRTDGELDIALDLASADGKVCQYAFSGHFITGERYAIIHRHPRLRSWLHPPAPLFLSQRAGSNKPNWSSSARVNGMG